MKIPSISSGQMAKIDSLAVNHFGIEMVQLMENAGRAVAELAREVLKSPEHKNILVLAGKGNNGGDGLVAARFLHNWGAKVDVIIAGHPDSLKEQTRVNSGVLRSMYVPLLYPTDAMKFEAVFSKADMIIDCLLGRGINGDPKGMYAELIRAANASGKKILAVDVPSGLDGETGMAHEPCIRARWTVTFAMPKKGLMERKARGFTGGLYVADIGIPREAYQLIGIDVPAVFSKSSIVKL